MILLMSIAAAFAISMIGCAFSPFKSEEKKSYGHYVPEMQKPSENYDLLTKTDKIAIEDVDDACGYVLSMTKSGDISYSCGCGEIGKDFTGMKIGFLYDDEIKTYIPYVEEQIATYIPHYGGQTWISKHFTIFPTVCTYSPQTTAAATTAASSIPPCRLPKIPHAFRFLSSRKI